MSLSFHPARRRRFAAWSAALPLVGALLAAGGCATPKREMDPAERWFAERPETWHRTTWDSPELDENDERTKIRLNDDTAGHHPSGTSQASAARSRSLVVGPYGSDLSPVPLDRVVTASGLVIEDVVRGDGQTCLPGMSVRVRYTASLADGPVFDRADGDAVLLPLEDCVIAWRDGLPGMRVGGVRRLVSPPALAFGGESLVDEDGKVVVPGGSTVVFMVELLGLEPNGA